MNLHTKAILLLLLATPMLLGHMHKFYVGLCIVDVRQEKSTLEISQKLFTDDLELATQKAFGKALNINTANELPETDSLLAVYCAEHFSAKGQGELLNMTFIGHEGDLAETWCYFEIALPKDRLPELVFRNTMLMEVFPSQKHMLKIREDKKIETYYLNREHPGAVHQLP